jgi:hypothetical protein
MQIGNLDETESLMAQYLVDTTLTDVQFLTERPRCSAAKCNPGAGARVLTHDCSDIVAAAVAVTRALHGRRM